MDKSAKVSSEDLRAQARELAQLALLDALITYAAACHHENLTGVTMLIEEWVHACRRTARASDELLIVPERLREHGDTINAVVSALLADVDATGLLGVKFVDVGDTIRRRVEAIRACERKT